MTTTTLHHLTANANLGVLGRIMERLKHNRSRRVARQALLRLEDHLLDDLGITRNTIQSDEF